MNNPNHPDPPPAGAPDPAPPPPDAANIPPADGTVPVAGGSPVATRGVTPPPGPGSESTPPGAASPQIPGSEKKLVAGLLAILLGGFGVHKFYLGYTNEGVIMLVVTVVVGFGLTAITCGFGAPAALAMPIIGLIEGLMYLTKTDEEFVATYVTGRKPWF